MKRVNKITINMGWPLLLFVILAILKSLGVITWSWAWIFAPIWFPILAIILVVILMQI